MAQWAADDPFHKSFCGRGEYRFSVTGEFYLEMLHPRAAGYYPAKKSASAANKAVVG